MEHLDDEFEATLVHQLLNTSRNHSNITDLLDPVHHVPESVRLLVNVLAGLIGLVGIGLNLLLLCNVLVARVWKQDVASSYKSLIVSLSTADLLLLIFSLPYELIAVNDLYWLENQFSCKVSALMCEMSRFAWIGSLTVTALPPHWPGLKSRRHFPAAWMALAWTVSIALTTPFGVHVDCIYPFTLFHDEWVTNNLASSWGLKEEECLCSFDIGPAQVARLFQSSLVLCTFLSFATLLIVYCSRKVIEEGEQRPSPATFGLMAFAFLVCTLPRYVSIILSYSETADATDEVALSLLNFCGHGLFYLSTLIHSLLLGKSRQFVKRFLARHMFRKPDRFPQIVQMSNVPIAD